MRQQIQLILFIIIINLLCAHNACALTQVASEGQTLITTDINKMKVQIKINTHEMKIGKPSDGKPLEKDSSCTYSKYPCSIVDRIDFLINGEALFTPRSVFCDIADLSKAEVQVIKKGAILTLYGGDASESYIVKIEFNSNQIKRRTLYSSMSPDNLLQETIYHIQVLGD